MPRGRRSPAPGTVVAAQSWADDRGGRDCVGTDVLVESTSIVLVRIKHEIVQVGRLAEGCLPGVIRGGDGAGAL